MAFHSMHRSTFTYGIILAGSMLGCARQEPSTKVPGPKITEVDIQGRGELSASEILEYISLRPSRFLGESYYYLHGSENIARRQLVDLYRSSGYYNVQVDPLQVQIKGANRPLGRQRAKIKIRIHPGQATTISKIEWTHKLQHLSDEQALSTDQLNQRSGLALGQRFSVEQFNRAKDRVTTAMQEKGYSDATVQERAVVNRGAQSAQLSFNLNYGPRVRIDAVNINGVQYGAKRFAYKLAAPSIGTYASPRTLEEIEKKIYELGIASAVQTELSPGKDTQHRTLSVNVTPRDPSQLSVGVSTHIDAAVWSQRLGLRYAHKNLFHQLLQLKTSLSGGWALLPLSDGSWHNSPLIEGDIQLTKPTLFKHHTQFFVQTSTSAQPREGYDLWRVDGKLGATQSYAEHASLTLSYNISWLKIHAFLNRRASQAQAVALLQGQRPFLSFLELQAQYFRLDRRINPKHGFHALLTYQIASRALGSQSEYQRMSPELRSYLNPLAWMVIASRARVGFILPFGKSPGARFDQRFYLGGVSSIRGWPLRSLSPFISVCDGQNECIDTPYGGNSEFLANLELRFNVWQALDLVTFLDAADVRNEVFSVSPGAWMYSTGGGLRYSTPIGAIRLDAGYQLNHDLKRFRKTSRFAIHLALGDSF